MYKVDELYEAMATVQQIEQQQLTISIQYILI